MANNDVRARDMLDARGMKHARRTQHEGDCRIASEKLDARQKMAQ